MSRYTEILMDAIKDYVASILMSTQTVSIFQAVQMAVGMTLNMAIHYPDYFAALVPKRSSLCLLQLWKNEDGTTQTSRK